MLIQGIFEWMMANCWVATIYTPKLDRNENTSKFFNFWILPSKSALKHHFFWSKIVIWNTLMKLLRIIYISCISVLHQPLSLVCFLTMPNKATFLSMQFTIVGSRMIILIMTIQKQSHTKVSLHKASMLQINSLHSSKEHFLINHTKEKVVSQEI